MSDIVTMYFVSGLALIIAGAIGFHISDKNYFVSMAFQAITFTILLLAFPAVFGLV